MPPPSGSFNRAIPDAGDANSVRLACLAMNCRFEILLEGDDPVALRAAGEEAIEEIHALDRQLSYFDPTSDISRLNRRAARAPIKIEPGLFDLLSECKSLWSKTGGAFDLEQEDVKTRERYGLNRSGQTALLARRLVEAGVTFVTVIDPGVGLSSSGWDLHTKLEWGMNTCCPRMDQAVTTLIEDLHERGLNKKVLVVVWGEFGRTPKINANGGRDHWGRLQSMLLAGGNYQHGQVIGSSNAKGEIPQDRPLWPYDVVATMYHHLGINPRLTPQTSVGQSVPILEKGEVISELL